MDVEIFIAAVKGDGVRGIGLDLHTVCPGFLRRMDDLPGPAEAAGMVGGHLCDEVGGSVWADDGFFVDFDFLHGCHFLFPKCCNWYLSA